MQIRAIRFDNLERQVTQIAKRSPRIRNTIATVHFADNKFPHEQMVPMGLQLPRKAELCGELNYTSLQGGIKPKEKPIDALFREAREEYNLGVRDVFEADYLVSTLVPIRPGSDKAANYDAQWLHWYYLITGRDVRANPEDVAGFAWFCGPDQVFSALGAVREEKLSALVVALSYAIKNRPKLNGYADLANLAETAPMSKVA